MNEQNETLDPLTGQEKAFLRRVRKSEGRKNRAAPHLGNDQIPLWPRLEARGLIRSVGSYSWVITALGEEFLVPQRTKAYPLRLKADMRQRLDAQADITGRTLHNEIVRRLEESFEPARDAYAELAKLRALVEDLFTEYDREFTDEESGPVRADRYPGHEHNIPGLWNKDGSECKACTATARLREFMEAPNPVQAPISERDYLEKLGDMAEDFARAKDLLKYDRDCADYRTTSRGLPPVGTRVRVDTGDGVVVGHATARHGIKVRLDSNPSRIEIHDSWDFIGLPVCVSPKAGEYRVGDLDDGGNGYWTAGIDHEDRATGSPHFSRIECHAATETKAAELRAMVMLGLQLIAEPLPAVSGAWIMAVGDWRDETVAIHGPNGHIASGLPQAVAKALVDTHNAYFPPATAAASASGGLA